MIRGALSGFLCWENKGDAYVKSIKIVAQWTAWVIFALSKNNDCLWTVHNDTLMTQFTHPSWALWRVRSRRRWCSRWRREGHVTHQNGDKIWVKWVATRDGGERQTPAERCRWQRRALVHRHRSPAMATGGWYSAWSNDSLHTRERAIQLNAVCLLTNLLTYSFTYHRHPLNFIDR